jgi:hypothetical protein
LTSVLTSPLLPWPLGVPAAAAELCLALVNWATLQSALLPHSD